MEAIHIDIIYTITMLRDRARERVRERIDEAAVASSQPVKSGARSAGTTTRADPKFDGKIFLYYNIIHIFRMQYMLCLLYCTMGIV